MPPMPCSVCLSPSVCELLGKCRRAEPQPTAPTAPTVESASHASEGKVRLDLIHPLWTWSLGQVCTAGAAKYGRWNWLKGMPWSELVGSAKRHIELWLSGESTDPETGCHHLAHAAWNCLALMTYHAFGLGVDDRPKPAKEPPLNVRS